MDNKQELENFKNAVFSTAKAIARSTISIDDQQQVAKVHIPKIISANNQDEELKARDTADSEALRIRYNN